MQGAGRSLDVEAAQDHAQELIYIIHDNLDFPKVRVVFKRGSDLIKDFPSCKIRKTKREVLFGS